MQKLANDDTQSEDRRSLLMRCDRAETRARKNEEQMMENAKKFAREISELKTKLAEKDAKLAGGFGAPSAYAHMPDVLLRVDRVIIWLMGMGLVSQAGARGAGRVSGAAAAGAGAGARSGARAAVAAWGWRRRAAGPARSLRCLSKRGAQKKLHFSQPIGFPRNKNVFAP